MRKLSLIILVAALITGFLLIRKKNDAGIVIGIVEPLQHKAMDEIVAGFSETLAKNFHKKYTLKVENAQNDNNLQRAILEKMKDTHYNMVIPIGTMPTQMAVSLIHEKPIISLAAEFSEEDRKKLKSCNIAVIHDEIPSDKILKFIHAAYPSITKLSLIHSSADKVLPEVPKAITAAKSYGITMDHFMVSTLPDLTSTAQALPSDTQGIFILKDHLIVSGIDTLAQTAAQKRIPLITSDEGSVEGGASFALGVREKQIGIEGAMLAAKVLNGASACSLPIQGMMNLNVFVNRQALLKQNVKQDPIQQAAQLLNYPVDFVTAPAVGKQL